MRAARALAALGLALLLVSVPLIRADEEEGGEDDKDVVVITKDNWDDKIKKSKFALVGRDADRAAARAGGRAGRAAAGGANARAHALARCRRVAAANRRRAAAAHPVRRRAQPLSPPPPSRSSSTPPGAATARCAARGAPAARLRPRSGRSAPRGSSRRAHGPAAWRVPRPRPVLLRPRA
jgi:hypothetical protein